MGCPLSNRCTARGYDFFGILSAVLAVWLIRYVEKVQRKRRGRKPVKYLIIGQAGNRRLPGSISKKSRAGCHVDCQRKASGSVERKRAGGPYGGSR